MNIMLNVISWLMLFLHPFHVSLIEIFYNQPEKNVEITLKIFFDDFENTLNKNKEEKFDVIKPKNIDNLNMAIENYIKNHLKIHIEEKEFNFKYLGFKIEKEHLLCFCEINKVEGFNKIEINQSLLYDFFPNQINIFTINNGKTEKSFRLFNPNTKYNLSFQ